MYIYVEQFIVYKQNNLFMKAKIEFMKQTSYNYQKNG